MAKRRILVVEDEGITALHLQSILEEEGYEITSTAITCEEALEFVEEIQPELVLLDIKLAGELNGIETGRQLRASYPHMRLIYITSYSQQDIRAQADETNPSGYLIKPITKEELFKAVKNALAD